VHNVPLPSLTILQICRCVHANMRVWELETCVLCAARGSLQGSGRQVLAATGLILPSPGPQRDFLTGHEKAQKHAHTANFRTHTASPSGSC